MRPEELPTSFPENPGNEVEELPVVVRHSTRLSKESSSRRIMTASCARFSLYLRRHNL